MSFHQPPMSPPEPSDARWNRISAWPPPVESPPPRLTPWGRIAMGVAVAAFAFALGAMIAAALDRKPASDRVNPTPAAASTTLAAPAAPVAPPTETFTDPAPTE